MGLVLTAAGAEAGIATCAPGSVTAFTLTWQTCGNVTGGSSSLTVDSTTGTVVSGPLAAFVGTGYLTTDGVLLGADGSAAKTTFSTPFGGTLGFHYSDSNTIPFYALVILDGTVKLNVSNSTSSGSGSGTVSPISLGTGSHTLAVSVTNSFSLGVLGAVTDPMMTIDIFTLNIFTATAPEPATYGLVAPVLIALGLLRRRIQAR